MKILAIHACDAGGRGTERPLKAYTRAMLPMVADLRARADAEVRALSPAERLALAFRLGDEDLESFRAAHGLDPRAAMRLLERRRQATRQPSACLDRLIG